MAHATSEWLAGFVRRALEVSCAAGAATAGCYNALDRDYDNLTFRLSSLLKSLTDLQASSSGRELGFVNALKVGHLHANKHVYLCPEYAHTRSNIACIEHRMPAKRSVVEWTLSALADCGG